MWKLSKRDNKIRQWSEQGEFQSINDAARRVLELEDNPLGALFFRVYVDPPARNRMPKFSVVSNTKARKAYICCDAPCSDFFRTP